jgi:hypothetical protein
MTPSVAAASPNVAPAAPFAVVSTAVHDREWWAEEAVRAGTDRSGLVAAAVEMMVAAGMVELPQPETITPWDAPSWRRAAAEYHKYRGDRVSIVPYAPEYLARLRQLLDDNVSLERCWVELNQRRGDGALEATVEALVYELRTRGLAALEHPNCLRRLSDVSSGQLREVLARLIRLRSNYPAITDDLLLTLGNQL